MDRELARLKGEWVAQAHLVSTRLADRLRSAVRANLPPLLTSGPCGPLAVCFALAGLVWTSIALDRAVIQYGFDPAAGAGSVAIVCAIAATAMGFLVRRRHRRDRERTASTPPALAESGRELIERTKAVAKRGLNPQPVLREHAVRVAAGAVILGFLVGVTRDERPRGR